MNNRIVFVSVLVLAVVVLIFGQGQALLAGKSYSVLFIGNSHTYYNEMPSKFSSIVINGQGTYSRVSSLTVGGYSLSQHTTNSNTLSSIDNGYAGKPWDYVILQEHGSFATYSEVDTSYRNEFQSSARYLYDRIKNRNPNAKVLLFENTAWHSSYFTEPDYYLGATATDMQARIRKWCNDTAYSYVPAKSVALRKNDMSVVRIGDAWERNYNDPKAIRLHVTEDYWHPNLSGTYLGALVVYSTIFQANPMNITYNAGLDANTAAYLRGIAAATVPEPSSALSLFAGIMAVGGIVRSRRR